MRLLFLNPTGQLGGAETSLLEILLVLREKQPLWTLQTLVPSPGPFVDKLRELGFSVVSLPFSDRIAELGDAGLANWQDWANLSLRIARVSKDILAYCARLRNLIRNYKPTLIHSNGFKMHLLASQSAPPNVPVIWHLHDFLSSRRLMAPLMKYAANRCQGAIAISESVAKDAQRLLPPKISIKTIYHSVNANRFSPHGETLDLDALANLPPAPTGLLRIGLISTFARWKGHQLFLESLGQAPTKP